MTEIPKIYQYQQNPQSEKMRGGTVQINWHDTKPVLTLDFHPFSGLLATGGADFDIKVVKLSSFVCFASDSCVYL